MATPEGLSPEEVRAIIAAAGCERDRLLLRVLWVTGAGISEVLALRPMDVQRDSLVLPNRKNPNLTVKRVFLPGAERLHWKTRRAEACSYSPNRSTWSRASLLGG